VRKLYLDIGNTRAKWLLDEGGLFRRGWVELGKGCDREGLQAIADSVCFVAVSCVKGDEYVRALASTVMDVWGVTLSMAVTSAAQLGVTCAYGDPSRLGIDRWLVMLAAWNRYKSPICIVDCGSAITIDLVTLDGLHMGGYILPGLRLGVEGLLKGTDKVVVDFDNLAKATLTVGKNTTEAVYNGALFSLDASVNAAMKVLRKCCRRESCILLLTGGDGQLLSELTTLESVYDEDLVLHGLKLYFDNTKS
jgi:type III pantothenate kinase